MGHVWVILTIWMTFWAMIGLTIISMAETHEVKTPCYDGAGHKIINQECIKPEITDSSLKLIYEIASILLVLGIFIVPIICMIIQDIFNKKT